MINKKYYTTSFFFLLVSILITLKKTTYLKKNIEDKNEEECSSIKSVSINNINIQYEEQCEDKHEMCSEWSLVGECDSNPNFMLEQCKESCRICQSKRCHDKNTDECIKLKKDIGCYIEGMKDDCMWTCSSCDAKKGVKECIRNPEHQPSIKVNTTNEIFEGISKLNNAKTHSKNPWIITVDDIVPNNTCDKIIKNIYEQYWTPSIAGDGKGSARTSSTFWCNNRCKENTILLRNFVNDHMKINEEYAEPLQILRYKSGQFYKEHHDQNSPRSSPWGERIFTVFFYLSDVEEGGETNFPRLNITIKPKKGSVLIWPNIMNDDPNKRDERTFHESLPVIHGTKHSANYWLHLYPFGYYSQYCRNSAYYENW